MAPPPFQQHGPVPMSPSSQYPTYRPPPQQENGWDDQYTSESDEETDEEEDGDQQQDQGFRKMVGGQAHHSPILPSRSATHHEFNASVGLRSSPSSGSRMTAQHPTASNSSFGAGSYGSGSDRGSLADRFGTSYLASIVPPRRTTSRATSSLQRGASSTGLRNAAHARTHASSTVTELGRASRSSTPSPVVTRVEQIWLPPASEYERERQEEAARLRERDRERERERKREATTPFRIPQHKPTTMSIMSTGTPTRTSRPGGNASVYLPGSSAQYSPVVPASPVFTSGRPPSMYPSSVASSNRESIFSTAAPGSSYTSSGTAFLHGHTISESPPSSPQLFPHGPNALHPPPRKQTFAAIQDGPLREAITSAEAIHREAGGPQNVDIWEENLRSEQEIIMQQIARERRASVGNDPPSSAGPSSSRQATSSSTTGTSPQRRNDEARQEFLERNAERRSSGLQRQREEVEARERQIAQEREDVRRRKERQKRESEEAAVNMCERERQREVEIMPNRAAGTLADLRKHYDDLNITNSISSVSTYVSGCGGHADIYKGLWTPSRTNRKSTEPITVAVKRLRVYVESGTESANIRKLRQEISIWRRLRHDNVQMLHGLWWDDPNVFPGMVSTWEDHGDINAYLKKLQSSTGTNELVNIKLSLLTDVLQGLIYLHSQKVIHADLKGANILVSRDGKALLTDFGIAWTLVKTSQSFTADRDSKGSTRWMAPELLAGSDGPQALYTTGSDAWAYGCLFLEVCSGLLPYFTKHTEPQVIRAVCFNLGPCRPDNMDDKLWAIVEYCCTYSVERRPSAAEIFVRLLSLRFPPDASDSGSGASVGQHSVVTLLDSPPPTPFGLSTPSSPTDSDYGSVPSMLRSPSTSRPVTDNSRPGFSPSVQSPTGSLRGPTSLQGGTRPLVSVSSPMGNARALSPVGSTRSAALPHSAPLSPARQQFSPLSPQGSLLFEPGSPNSDSSTRSRASSVGLPDSFEADMILLPDVPWQSLPDWAQRCREECLVNLHSKNMEVEQRYRAGLEDVRGRGRGKKDTRELEATRRSSLSRNADEEVRRLLKMLQFSFLLQQPVEELPQWEKDFEENPLDHILHVVRGIYLGHGV